MPAAVAVPALIGGAAAIGGAIIQSRSADKANKTIQQGTQKSEQALRDAYGQQQAIYQQMQGPGTAYHTLGSLLAPPPGARMAGQAPTFGGPPPQGPAPQTVPQRGMPQIPQNLPSVFGIRDRFGPGPQGAAPPSLGAMGGPGGGMPPGMPPQGPQGPPAAGGMVTLRSPDGQMGQVPAHLADQFIARGAQRV